MVAIGFLVIWGGYSLGLFGWTLFRDYDVTFGQLVNPVHPYRGKWPPAKIPDTQIWPGGAAAGGGGKKAPKPGQCPKGWIWDDQTKRCLQELP